MSNVTLYNNVPLKMSNSIMQKAYVQGISFLLLNNTIEGKTIVGGSSLVQDNILDDLYINMGPIVVTNNTIETLISNFDCGSPVITDNKILAIGSLELSSNATKINYFVATSPVIANNIISRGMYLDSESATVSNNTIYGYEYTYTWVMWERLLIMHTNTRKVTSSGISIKGNASVSGNTIYGCEAGIEGLKKVEGNTIYNCTVGIKDGTTIQGNLLIGNYYGIKPTSQAIIQNNTLIDNSVAIDASNITFITIKDNLLINNNNGIIVSGDVIIERNFMSNISLAVRLDSQVYATIQNNTFTDNAEAIRHDGEPFYDNSL